MTTYNFTGTNGDPLPGGLTAQSGTFEIQSNTLVATGTIPATTGSICTQPSNADDFVEATYNAEGSAATAPSGVLFRYSGVNNYWMVVIRPGVSELNLWKLDAGVFTLADTYIIPAFDANINYVLRAEFTGTSIVGKIDGVTRVSTTAAFNQTATLSGLRFGDIIQSIDDLTVPNAIGGNSVAIATENYVMSQAGTITFDVDWTGTPTTIEYSVDGGGFVTGDATPTGDNSLIPITLAAGEHSIEFRFSNDVAATDTITNAAVGDVFAMYGQSDSMGAGDNNQTFTPNGGGATAHLFGNDYEFKLLSDPYDSDTNQVDLISADAIAAGSNAVRFANAYLAANNTPICLVPCNKSGTPIAEFLKTSAVRIGGLNQYESMQARAVETGGLAGVIFSQGEGDANDTNATTRAQYTTDLNQLIDDIFADFGVKTVIRAMYNITAAGYNGNGVTTGQEAIRLAQIDVGNTNANAKITVQNTDIDISTGDGLHVKTNAQLDLVGVRQYDAFVAVSSTLTITATGIPDGNYLVTVTSDVRPATMITSEVLTFTGGTTTFSPAIPAGTQVYAIVRDNLDPSNEVAPMKAVTT